MDSFSWITPQEAEGRVDEAIQRHAKHRLRGRILIANWIGLGELRLEAKRKTRIWYRDNRPIGEPEVVGPVSVSLNEWRQSEQGSLYDCAQLRFRRRNGFEEVEAVFSGIRLSLDDLRERLEEAGLSNGDMPLLPHSRVVEWCRHWIESGKGNGMDKAWEAFRTDPQHAGLSRDDAFRPAWKEAKLR